MEFVFFNDWCIYRDDTNDDYLLDNRFMRVSANTSLLVPAANNSNTSLGLQQTYDDKFSTNIPIIRQTESN